MSDVRSEKWIGGPVCTSISRLHHPHHLRCLRDGQGVQPTHESQSWSGGSRSRGTMVSRHAENTSATSPMIALLETTQCSGIELSLLKHIEEIFPFQCSALLRIRLSATRPPPASEEGRGLGGVPRGEPQEQPHILPCCPH